MSDLSTEHANSAVLEGRRSLAVDLLKELSVRHDMLSEQAERSHTPTGYNLWMGKAFGVRIAMEIINSKFHLTEQEIWA